ncbi:MAG: hypothetical protein R2825_03090 [Saprospiraceae bacterium]
MHHCGVQDIPYEKVVDVIRLAGRMRVRAILATQPIQEGNTNH